MNNKKKQAVLSLSGGMDSSSLLLHLLANGYEVIALSFDYGQKHRVELERATDLVAYINAQLYKVGEPYGKVRHQIIKLDGLQQLLNSALVTGGNDVPEGHYEQDNMKETVVPNRNKIFSSIIQAVALSLATTGDRHNVSIAMGIHAGDHAIYPDCRQEFRDKDFEAFQSGNWDSEYVQIYTPYLHTDKFGILKDGSEACEALGLDFDEVYARTNTSYKPIWIYHPGVDGLVKELDIKDGEVAMGTWHSLGKWYSDYKSAASVERIEAFINLGRPDPVAYADETGPVTWEVAKAHVEKVLTKHLNK